MTNSGIVRSVLLPAASVTVIVSPVYVPSLRVLNVTVFSPEETEELVEKPKLEVKVPLSLDVNMKLGVVLLEGVVIEVDVPTEGAVVSILTDELSSVELTALPVLPAVSTKSLIEKLKVPSVSPEATV